MTQNNLEQVNKQNEIMNKSHKASSKNLEMQTRQLSHHVASIPGCGGGFLSNIIDNTINESYKARIFE